MRKALIKKGVSLQGLQPEMTVALMMAMNVLHGFNLDCIITSATDGKHMAGSRHYLGYALDLRSKHIPRQDVYSVMDDIKRSLTDDFDVLLEGLDTESEHIHIEMDVKSP